MRGIGLFFGGMNGKRNDPVKVVDPHPVHDYGDDVEKGNAGLDGYTCLSRANPNAQGSPPPVAGVIGPVYNGPANDFEQ
jgi:hypothetical protein